MELIKKFIQDFIKAEYNCIKTEYDFCFSDKEYELLRKEASIFYHSYLGEQFYRGIEEDEFEEIDDDEKEEYAKNVLSAIPRILFQIKKYTNFSLGDTLKRIVKGEYLYACDLSYNENTGKPLNYSRKFYVTETNEGLKIIYNLSFNTRISGAWSHSHDLEALQVKNEGDLIEIEKYQAPEEVNSLADYNAE